MKRTSIIKSIIFAAVALVAGGAWAAWETVGDYTWYYRINGETAEITDDGGEVFSSAIWPEPTGAVTVPAALGGYPVTSIGQCAFYCRRGLTSVTIPNSVTNIGYEAFYDCSGLTSVHIADLAAWCRISFSDSYDNPLYYAHNLYLNGTLVTNLVIPVGVTSIGALAFSGCSGLTSVTIPNSVTNIGDEAFEDCRGLTSVTIPDSVTSIGALAFSGCSGLTSVHIADLAAWCRISFSGSYANPLYYAHNLYLNGTLVTNLVIPVGVTIIGDLAFSGCSGLTSVTIPNSVTSIGQYAFYNCSGLTSVTIPDSVTDLSETAFDGCGKLWTAWYRTLANSSASGGGSVLGADPRYALSSVAADRAIASVTVDSDTAIDSFVLTDGKVYDTALYVVNSSASEVHLSLPGGYVYVTPKGKTPLALPSNSMNLLTITRLAERTFLVSRQLLEIVK